MKKVFTWKVIRKWLILSTVFVVGFGVSFVYGTFNPNYFVKSIWQEKLETKHALWAHSLGLHSPSMEYNNRMEFIEQLNKCVDYLNFTTPPNQRIPMNMLTAQAVLESAWGESRFAIKANNLFGIRTFNKETGHMLPIGIKKWPGWGVRIFKTKCDSVKEYMRLLNYHYAYAEFREERTKMLKDSKTLDGKILITKIKAFSTTEDYDKRVLNTMTQIDKILEEKAWSDVGEIEVDENKLKKELGEVNIEVKEKPEIVLPKSKPENNS